MWKESGKEFTQCNEVRQNNACANVQTVGG
jgi:hypothetical protein